MSTATHVTMDVKGSFAGAGGISVMVAHDQYGSPERAGPWWSAGAAATDLAVGANPGDVTEWTTILIPINQPTSEATSGLNGTWRSRAGGGFSLADWDAAFSAVNVVHVMGLTPDSQIDNLGFVLPDAGLPGDFDQDDDVDGNDFLYWQINDGSPAGLQDWQDNFPAPGPQGAASLAAVPEPSTLFLLVLASGGLFSRLLRDRARI
jgi:hypothetical protein